MPSKISMLKIENTIGAGLTAGTTFSNPIRGRILSVKVQYSNTTPASTSDRDVNLWEMNPADDDDVTDALQELLNIGTLGADPEADNNVYYPRRAAEDIAGTALVFASTDIVPTEFVVFGIIMLQVTAAAAGDITTVHLMVEEIQLLQVTQM